MKSALINFESSNVSRPPNGVDANLRRPFSLGGHGDRSFAENRLKGIKLLHGRMGANDAHYTFSNSSYGIEDFSDEELIYEVVRQSREGSFFISVVVPTITHTLEPECRAAYNIGKTPMSERDPSHVETDPKFGMPNLRVIEITDTRLVRVQLMIHSQRAVRVVKRTKKAATFAVSLDPLNLNKKESSS